MYTLPFFVYKTKKKKRYICMRNTKAAKEEQNHKWHTKERLSATSMEAEKTAQDSTETIKTLSGNKSKFNICHLSWCLNNYQKEHKKLHGNESPLSPPPVLHHNKRRSWGHCEGCLHCWNDKNRTAGSGSDQLLKAEL